MGESVLLRLLRQYWLGLCGVCFQAGYFVSHAVLFFPFFFFVGLLGGSGEGEVLAGIYVCGCERGGERWWWFIQIVGRSQDLKKERKKEKDVLADLRATD